MTKCAKRLEHEATVETVTTLAIPNGYSTRDKERRVVKRCAPAATAWLLRAEELWGWDEMRVDVTYGNYGRCYCGAVA